MTRPVYRDGRVHVLARKCDTCIFRPGNLMDLNPGRLKDMVDSATSVFGGNIPCHEVMDTDAPAICRGFYDAHGERIALLDLARRMGRIEEQPYASP